MRAFFFVLAAIALLFVAVTKVVRAEDVTLEWQAPTGSETCTADTTVPEPINYRLYQMVAEVPGDALTHTFPAMLPGDYTYMATTVVNDEEGNPLESRGSGVATKTVASFKAAAGAQVYQVVTIENDFWFLPIGTVAQDTECLTEVRAKQYYAIPRDSVDWSPGSSARPQLVVAECQ